MKNLIKKIFVVLTITLITSCSKRTNNEDYLLYYGHYNLNDKIVLDMFDNLNDFNNEIKTIEEHAKLDNNPSNIESFYKNDTYKGNNILKVLLTTILLEKSLLLKKKKRKTLILI